MSTLRSGQLGIKAAKPRRAAAHRSCTVGCGAVHHPNFRQWPTGFGKELPPARRARPEKTAHICRASASAPVVPGLRNAEWTGSAREVEALRQVEERMKQSQYGAPSTNTCKWFLRDRSFDVDETVDKLKRMMKWRTEFGVDDITDEMVAAEASTRKAELLHRVDAYRQPVVLVRVDKHVTGATPMDDSMRLCVHVVEQAVQQAEESGTETILGIFDLGRFTTENADISFAAFLIDVFFTYYPKRLSQVLLVDAPWIFQPAWAVIKPLLRKYSALVRFVSSEEVRREYFEPGSCPEEFL